MTQTELAIKEHQALIGQIVKVVLGRDQGVIGKVFWLGINKFARPNPYAPSWMPLPVSDLRVGIKMEDGGKVFTSVANITLI
jgi:hypothetical protein